MNTFPTMGFNVHQTGSIPIRAQHAKFVEVAKRLGTDDDPERFKETVKRLARAKPEKVEDERTEEH